MNRKNRDSLLYSDDSALDEKKIKTDDASSLSTTETLLNRSLPFSNFNFENIRFIPEAIEFLDAFEGKQFSEKMTIQNIGRNPVYIKVAEPNSFIFQLKKPIRRAKILGSGCSITRTVSYTYRSEDLVHCSQIPVYVNGQLMFYHLTVKKAKPKIEVQPRTLDFKIVNLGSSAKPINLTIFNTGGKRTKFEVDVKKNFFNLVANPMRGTVKAKDFMNVTVEMTGLSEGEFYQELWIKTAELPIRVPVLVEIVRPRIEIVYPNRTEDLALISFRLTFIGTQRVESIVLKNHSAENTTYIIAAEVNGELQLLKDARISSNSFKMFSLSSEEGQLKPFENRILNVVFRPVTEVKKKGWHHEEYQKRNETQQKFVTFFRIIKIHCIGRKELSMTSEQIKIDYNYVNQNKTSSQQFRPKTRQLGNMENLIMNSQPLEEVLRFCLLGEAVEPDILVQPLSFDFGDLSLGQTENRVLRVTNNSPIAVKCTCGKICNVKTTPKEVWLKSEKAHEFLVSLTPTCAGRFKTKMKVQILAESDVVSANKSLETIAVYSVVLSYNANDVFSIPLPKIGLGITPLITDEVGLQKELITFKNASEFPQAALLGLKQGFKPEWMKKERNQLKCVDNAMIALPNDRPRLFYSWPKDKICRTIFKGFYRYSPPDDLTYTLSSDGRIERKERRAVWADYISALRELRLLKCSQLGKFEYYLKYDESCMKQHNVEDYKRDSNFELNTQIPKKFKEFLEQYECFPLDTFVPLSPLFLYNVVVEPKLINFSTVIIETVVQETVTVSNKNHFPIDIKFLSKNSTLSVSEKNTIIIQPSETKSVNVLFETDVLGRYVGVLNYIINRSHEFQISVCATVNPKILTLRDSTLSEELKKDPCQAISEVISNRNSELLKILNSKSRHPVNFISSRIDLGDVPLNLPTIVKPVIRNVYYHDVCFEVVSFPFGVVIEPHRGVMKARSFLPLNVKFNIPVIMKFSFEIMVVVNLVDNISVEITGNVVLPFIKISPPEVTMRKICAHSFETFAVCLENAGTTPAEIVIDFKNWPEFRVANNHSKIYLTPKKSSKVIIHFEPIDVARYVFYLPVIINNILGPPLIQNRETEYITAYISDLEDAYQSYGEVFKARNLKLKLPLVFINSTVTQGLIKLSSRRLRFQMDSDSNSTFQPQSIEISNEFANEVTFCIRNDDLGELNDSPFNLIPVIPNSVEYRLKSMKAHLTRGEKLLLEATFAPKKLGFYDVDVPIFVRGYCEGLVYNYIHLSGVLKSSRIQPETTEIHFPPLPLGVECDSILTICAESYNAPDFIHCIICESEAESNNQNYFLTVKWLNEPHMAQRGVVYLFKLQIQFQSSVPVALRNFILLFDSMGEYVSILVTAVADNSSLTNHAFLTTRASKYKLVRDEPFQWERKTGEVFLRYPINKNDLKFQSHLTNVNKKTESKNAEEESFDNLKLNSSVIPDDVLFLKKKKKDLSFEKTALTCNKLEHLTATAEKFKTDNVVSVPTDKGPRLVIQMTKSMTRITDLHYVKMGKKLVECEHKSSHSSVVILAKSDGLDSAATYTESFSTLGLSFNPAFKRIDLLDEPSYPNFPAQDNSNRQYFQDTLNFVERWLFEVVMKCDQYLSIPRSFQALKGQTVIYKVCGSRKIPVEVEVEKDFLDLLEEIIGKNHKLPERPALHEIDSPNNKAKALVSFFAKILKLLENEGCLLPHVRPEYLTEYGDYAAYCQFCRNGEFFTRKNREKSNSSRILQDQINLLNKSEKESVHKTSSEFSSDSWRKISIEHFLPVSNTELKKLEETNPDIVEPQKQQIPSLQTFSNEKQFEFREEIFDKEVFESRSTQAWLDVTIQLFRVFGLLKIVPKYTIPQVVVVEKGDKILTEAINLNTLYDYGKKSEKVKILPYADSFSSNVYSVQERILLDWLNRHLEVQKKILWKSEDESLFKGKVLNNFDKDLSNSIALIAVTASHCPYIVTQYFKDVFPKPDTLGKLHHNAGKLTEAWKTLEIGLTVNVSDLVHPNPVFMVMLVAHLYEVLPSLHPHSLICFSAPLNSETTRALPLKNESQERIIYRARFFGNHEELFQLKDEPYLELKHNKITNVNIKFTVKKIKKVDVTFFLNPVIPNFAKHLTFYFEGEPSQLPEHEKFTFQAPLYKVICAQVPIKPPYPEAATYEVWYTTKEPQYSHDVDICALFKPWSKIWKNKVSRRLFLNACEIIIDEKKLTSTLDVTIACFTKKKRIFWLLFRSKTSDFIITIEIKPKLLESQAFSTSYCTKPWSPSASCICFPEQKLTPNSAKCPFFMNLMIPKRNDALWDALKTMFFKTMNPEEKVFWAENFETNSGLCLILWLLSPDEEEEVIDEFVQILTTKVTYFLDLESNCEHVVIPSQIEIQDVRDRSDITVPIHLSKSTPLPLNLKIMMTSENEQEVRMLNIHLQPSCSDETSVIDDSRIMNSLCQPVCFGKPQNLQTTNKE